MNKNLLQKYKSNLSKDLQEKYLNAHCMVLRTIFLTACSDGDCASISYILSNKVLEEKLLDRDAETWFRIACYKGHTDIVKMLDEKKFLKSIDLYDGILCAVEENHNELIQYLLNHNKVKNHILFLFDRSIWEGNYNLVKKFLSDTSIINFDQLDLKNGIIKISKSEIDINEFLKKICSKNNLELIQFILENDNIPTQLTKAIDFKKLMNINDYEKPPNSEIIFYLLNYTDKNNVILYKHFFTGFLYKACEENHLPLVKLLLNHPNPNRKVDNSLDKDNILINACYNGHLNIVKYLLTSRELKEHANIHAHEDKALLAATQQGHLHVIKYLTTSKKLKEHANINTKDDISLKIAFKNDHADIMDFLLKSSELKSHPNVFKILEQIKDLHFNNLYRRNTEKNYIYEMKALNYLIKDYELSTNDPKFNSIVEDMLQYTPELKTLYRANQLNNELPHKSMDNSNNSQKLKI